MSAYFNIAFFLYIHKDWYDAFIGSLYDFIKIEQTPIL